MVDLAIIVVSANDGHWLEGCLSSAIEHAGDATLEVIVVDNGSTDATRELVASSFPHVRLISQTNRGFAAGNNRGLELAHARYLLLLNPDTEVIDGTFGELVGVLDARPEIGVVGARQIHPDGTLCKSIHRFPSVTRALGDALSSERWPIKPAWACEREVDPSVYARESECDWPTGSFLLVRREALLSAGVLDERFFLYCEEPDLCMRVKRAGWTVLHLPQMTIIHHAGKAGIQPRMLAQEAYSRKQYAAKHFGGGYGRAYLAALAARHLIRAASPHPRTPDARARRSAARLALLTLTGRSAPPFGFPPATAVEPLAAAGEGVVSGSVEPRQVGG
jgi:GT2 family glycosyltransferase